jgi:hypothetical protein
LDSSKLVQSREAELTVKLLILVKRVELGYKMLSVEVVKGGKWYLVDVTVYYNATFVIHEC